MSKSIVVATNGFVFLGVITRNDDVVLRLEEAQNIRTWGTTNGLGQIALQGPQAETVLDDCGVVEIKPHAVIYTIPCVYEKA